MVARPPHRLNPSCIELSRMHIAWRLNGRVVVHAVIHGSSLDQVASCCIIIAAKSWAQHGVATHLGSLHAFAGIMQARA
eukprot:7165384-Alexandrium_andersonii.AAC.1